MGLDFTRFEQAAQAEEVPRHPRDVFVALPRRRGYEYLRGPQDQILDQWSQRRGERDLVVKLNTGGGKTVVGLLIAQCSLEDGSGPVAYLVPDHYLAEQVRVEAAIVRGADVLDPDDLPALLVHDLHRPRARSSGHLPDERSHGRGYQPTD